MLYEAYHLTAATCPERVFVHSPVSTFHTRRVASREPLTTTEVQVHSVWVYMSMKGRASQVKGAYLYLHALPCIWLLMCGLEGHVCIFLSLHPTPVSEKWFHVHVVGHIHVQFCTYIYGYHVNTLCRFSEVLFTSARATPQMLLNTGLVTNCQQSHLYMKT